MAKDDGIMVQMTSKKSKSLNTDMAASQLLKMANCIEILDNKGGKS
jgi:hypothetical protein